MTIAEIQNEIIDEFSFFEDWEQRYEYLIELGKALPEQNEAFKEDSKLIKGCQSKVWLEAELVDDTIVFKADSDAILPKGIAALLVRMYSGQKVSDIVASQSDFIAKIGLQEFLSPTRANGLLSMIKQIKLYAVVFQSKLKS